MTPILAQSPPPAWQLALAAVAVVALVVRELFAYLRGRQPPNQALTEKHIEAIFQTSERVAEMISIMKREHPVTQTLRIYSLLDLGDRLDKLQESVDELADRSGVWTDPGRPT